MSPADAMTKLLVLLGWAGTQEVPTRHRERVEQMHVQASVGLWHLLAEAKFLDGARASLRKDKARYGEIIHGAYQALHLARWEREQLRRERDRRSREANRLEREVERLNEECNLHAAGAAAMREALEMCRQVVSEYAPGFSEVMVKTDAALATDAGRAKLDELENAHASCRIERARAEKAEDGLRSLLAKLEQADREPSLVSEDFNRGWRELLAQVEADVRQLVEGESTKPKPAAHGIGAPWEEHDWSEPDAEGGQRCSGCPAYAREVASVVLSDTEGESNG